MTMHSLHLWKNEVRLRYMAEQAWALLENLDAALAATEEQAPVRNRPLKLYRTARPQIRNVRGDWSELHWEEALFRYRNVFASSAPAVPWADVVTYQVLLRDTNADRGWGEIDLLGVSDDRLPVVIELKCNPNGEYLLRAIAEGVANAVAFRKAWPATAAEWNSLTHASVPSLGLPLLPVVCAAPSDYWATCIGSPGAHRSGQTFPDAWPPICELVRALADRGYPVHFAEILHGPADSSGLPQVTGARPVILPGQS